MKTGELAFGQFRLDRANALLWRGHDRVVLAPKPFEVLCCLVERAGELVTKDDLLDIVWSDLHVSESSLSVAMNALRAALGDDRLAPNYIETVPRRGYRFVASVTAASSAAVVAPAVTFLVAAALIASLAILSRSACERSGAIKVKF